MSVGIWPWIGLNAFILATLLVDLLAFHRRPHAIRFREALAWSGIWVALALAFNALLWWWRGPQAGLEFLTGYLIEKSLSVDNLFVFLMLFSAFAVPARLQHRVLFAGLLGALVMRLAFILAGVALMERFHAMIYVFGAVLVVSGVRLWRPHAAPVEPARHPLLRLLRRVMPVTERYEGDRFFVRRARRWLATPLFVVLLMVEITDLIFAVDSIPAVLAITRDPFIVYASNAFAILGLRALYFALAGFLGMFHHLHHGLSAILVFVGTKMMVSDFVQVPALGSLAVVLAILGVSVWASLRWPRAVPAVPERGDADAPPGDAR